jgi:hypothetical protein
MVKEKIICKILECEHLLYSCNYCCRFKTYIKQQAYPDCEKIREYIALKGERILIFKDFVDEVLQERF